MYGRGDDDGENPRAKIRFNSLVAHVQPPDTLWYVIGALKLSPLPKNENFEIVRPTLHNRLSESSASAYTLAESRRLYRLHVFMAYFNVFSCIRFYPFVRFLYNTSCILCVVPDIVNIVRNAYEVMSRREKLTINFKEYLYRTLRAKNQLDRKKHNF